MAVYLSIQQHSKHGKLNPKLLKINQIDYAVYCGVFKFNLTLTVPLKRSFPNAASQHITNDSLHSMQMK